jgi:anaerobic magnesium-protoporphyrin IX monomethyl ester cyclase
LIELSSHNATGIGARILSAALKQAGHKVRLVFATHVRGMTEAVPHLYPEHFIDQLIPLCKNSPLVGISFLTTDYYRAAQITKRLKQESDALVVWGGIHATVEPAQCLQHADGVCRGEGEEALVELVQRLEAGQDYRETTGFSFNRDGGISDNPMRPLIQCLDDLPFLDYDPAGDSLAWVDGQKRFAPLDKALLLQLLTPPWHAARPDIGTRPVYNTMASRGCPLKCAYCYHSTIKDMYARQRYIRRRSAGNIVEEISRFVGTYDFRGSVWFADDDFMAASMDEIKEFSELYKAKIGLPFFCLAGPTTIAEKKFELLTDAGLRYFEFGIQSGSTKTKKIFNRPFSTEKILDGCRLINKFKDKIPLPYYDFILDGPWEDLQDKRETLDLILQIPRPYELALGAFMYYPGSTLYEQAKKDGTITLESLEVYSGSFVRMSGNYIDFLIMLYGYYRVPRRIVLFLARPGLVKLLNRKSLAKFYALFYKLYPLVRRLF